MTAPAPRPPPTGAQLDADVDAAMGAARVLVGVIVRSIDTVEDQVTLPQLRILMLVATRDELNLSALADALGVHPSNASRACDRLVEAGLLTRRDSAADRRNLVLDLSRQGRAVVDSVSTARRDALRTILQRMGEEQRRHLGPVLLSFATAGGEHAAVDIGVVWS